jgi:hypothetical protein
VEGNRTDSPRAVARNSSSTSHTSNKCGDIVVCSEAHLETLLELDCCALETREKRSLCDYGLSGLCVSCASTNIARASGHHPAPDF